MDQMIARAGVSITTRGSVHCAMEGGSDVAPAHTRSRFGCSSRTIRQIALGRIAKVAKGRFHVFDEHPAVSGLPA